MFTIHIWDGNEKYEIFAEEAENADKVLKNCGLRLNLPCGGKGSCGKCKIQVEGNVSEPDSQELSLLSAAELEQGVRLACRCRITGDASICMPEAGDEKILMWAGGPDFQPEACELSAGLGIACDLGTTTIAMRLYDLKTAQVLSDAAEGNCQRAYGGDVISRVSACDESGVRLLSDLIRNQLTRLAEQCLKKAGVSEKGLSRAVITGNTVMLHILDGLDPHSLSVSPFALQSSFGRYSNFQLLGAPVYLPACIGAYIGADVLCAALASGMGKGDGIALLADIGTNGEMVLEMPDRSFLCCSAPAGPAFEGAGISMGMSASDGAIHWVEPLDDGTVTCGAIGMDAASAFGICGSGLLDCVAVMKKLNVLDETGYLEESFRIPGTHVKIQQQDIRQVQLAKSAVCAGIRTLLQKAGLPASDVDRFYIAGGFGNFMNLSSAAAIGLIPQELLPKARFMGNGALAGAAMLLLSERAREESMEMAGRATELHLAADPYFVEEYINDMSF